MKHDHRIVALAAASLLTAACGGSETGSSSGGAGGSGGTGGGQSAGDPPTTLVTAPGGTPIDKPAKNTYFFCPRPGLVPVITASNTPWLSGTTIDISKIASVSGTMTWQSEFSMSTTATERVLVGNGLPNHPTGQFPVQEGTPAYEYYSAFPLMGGGTAADIGIAAYDINLTLPRNPTPNDKPSCIHWIFIGLVTQTGAAWHAEIAPDAQFKVHDPISALPLDPCFGHPFEEQYHYHAYSWACFPNQGEKAQHSPLFGYAIDGFGIFGPRGENGELVTNDDLDECHGHTHEIDWDGEKKVMYHYHVNNEFPYTLGCYRGTPIELPEHLQH